MKPEIILGIVSPLGCKKDQFISNIKKYFNQYNYEVVDINVSKLICTDEISNDKYCDSFRLFLKMEICNLLRYSYKGAIGALVIEKIIYESNKRQKHKNNENGVVYLIDQLKNEHESRILNHVYGLNYIQLSLFSNIVERDKFIKERIVPDQHRKIFKVSNQNIIDNMVQEDLRNEVQNSIKKMMKENKSKYNFYDEYRQKIRSDSAHNLIEKDYQENSSFHEKTGQQVAKLFHKSHYFFNLDVEVSKLESEVGKFSKQLFGKYLDYPTQDEFGMAIAYHVSYRSNFPHDRHIGASIISVDGELISVGSIRAPNKTSNTKLAHQDSIADGYYKYKDQINIWLKDIEVSELKHSKDISTFLKDSIDFHPCTHAEMAALLDAAKIGVSVRNATLYTTTFPCHLCAKDIITAGISRVVYIEAYPKSKSKDLYPQLIDLNSQKNSNLVPFDMFSGVSPSRYHYVYSLKNKAKQEGNICFPPFLQYEHIDYYKQKEEDISSHFRQYLNGEDGTDYQFLDTLMR